MVIMLEIIPTVPTRRLGRVILTQGMRRVVSVSSLSRGLFGWRSLHGGRFKGRLLEGSRCRIYVVQIAGGPTCDAGHLLGPLDDAV